MSDEEMQELVKRARDVVKGAFGAHVLTNNDAAMSPLVAAVFSALVSNEQPAWK